MKKFNLLFAEEAPQQTEEPSGKVHGHTTHVEDYSYMDGADGYHHAVKHLVGMHNAMRGLPSDVKVGRKDDGSPSLVWGTNPENGKFFVATKAIGNKTPKINYTPEDIERNHGHAPGLVEKMNAALQHLPKVTPGNKVYQGDVMYTKPDVQDEGKTYSFTPNTLKYDVDKNSTEGKKVSNAQIGVSTHTEYKGDGTNTLAGMSPKFMPNLAKFKSHPDVHVISTKVPVDSSHYSDDQKLKFLDHMNSAEKEFQGMPKHGHDAVGQHADAIGTYLNHEIRQNGAPTHSGFMRHVREKEEKAISKLKTPSAIDRKRALLDQRLAHIQVNKPHIERALRLHNHLQKAKNTLINSLENNKQYGYSLGGQKSGPEGFVSVDKDNNISKFVRRQDEPGKPAFSAANFAMSKNRSQPTNTPE